MATTILGSYPSQDYAHIFFCVILWWAFNTILKSLASAVAEILKGTPKILGSFPGLLPLFLLAGMLWRALANPSRISILKSLASAIAEILYRNYQILGSSPSSGPRSLFIPGKIFMMEGTPLRQIWSNKSFGVCASRGILTLHGAENEKRTQGRPFGNLSNL